MSNHSMAKNAPYDGSFIQTNSSGAAGYAAALPISAGFPTTRPLLFPVANSAFNYFSRRYPNPSANEWNLNIQRQLTSRDVLSVAYIGQTGGHILLTYNMNEATPGAGAVASRRPYPNLADGSYSCMCGNSVFHSLQVTYMNHLSRGLDFQGAWTWGHSIDDSSGVGNAVAPQNIHNFALFRGNSDFDSRQSAVLSWSYVLPFGRNKQFASNAHGMEQMVVGGWKLNSIDTFRAGSPFTPVMSTSLLNAGTGVQWPNRIGSGKVSHPTAKQWFRSEQHRYISGWFPVHPCHVNQFAERRHWRAVAKPHRFRKGVEPNSQTMVQIGTASIHFGLVPRSPLSCQPVC